MLMITGTFRASGLSLAPSNTIIIRRMDCRLRLRAQSSSRRSVEEPSGCGAWRMSITAVLMEHPSSWQLCAGVTTDKPHYTHNNTHNNTDTNISLHPSLFNLMSAVTHTHLQTRRSQRHSMCSDASHMHLIKSGRFIKHEWAKLKLNQKTIPSHATFFSFFKE